MFKIGQKVVYPVHGAGVIEAVEDREILGKIRSYYILRLSEGDLHVLVPMDAAERSGLRPIGDMTDLKRMDAVLAAEPSPWEENWNRRYRMNMDKIKSGDICELAEVVRNLTLRDHVKGLSAGEKKMLDNARRILISEIILAVDITAEDAEVRLKHTILPFLQKNAIVQSYKGRRIAGNLAGFLKGGERASKS